MGQSLQKGLKKPWIPAWSLGKQLLHFACRGHFLLLSLKDFCCGWLPGPLPIGKVSFESCLFSRKISLAWTTWRDFFSSPAKKASFTWVTHIFFYTWIFFYDLLCENCPRLCFCSMKNWGEPSAWMLHVHCTLCEIQGAQHTMYNVWILLYMYGKATITVKFPNHPRAKLRHCWSRGKKSEVYWTVIILKHKWWKTEVICSNFSNLSHLILPVCLWLVFDCQLYLGILGRLYPVWVWTKPKMSTC